MTRSRSLVTVPVLVFFLLLIAFALVNRERPAPAAQPGLQKTSTSIWQLPEINHPEGVSPAPAPPSHPAQAPGGAPASTAPPVVLPPEVALPAKGADRQPPAAP